MNYFETFGYGYDDFDTDLPDYNDLYDTEYDSGRKVIDWLFNYCNENGYFSTDDEDTYLAKIPKDCYQKALDDIISSFPNEPEEELKLLIKNNIDI